MASSQVEIASSSPFGCVLRDRNQNNQVRTRDSNAFHKNFNDLLVQTPLGSCRNAGSNENSHPGIDVADLWVHHPRPPPPPPPSATTSIENNQHAWEMEHARISEHSNSNDNSPQRIDYTDLWVHNPLRNNDENTQNKSTSGGKCDNRARDTVHAVDRNSEISASSGPLACPPRGRTHDGVQSQPVSRVRSPEPLRSVSSSVGRSLETGPASTSQKEKSQDGKSSSPVFTSQTAEVPNSGAVSSLVQKWRSFEGRRSSSLGSNCSGGGSSFPGHVSFLDAPGAGGSDACEESADIRPDTPTISEESNGDWESVRTGFSASPGRDSDTAENEKIRVADIIRKLSCNGEEQHDRDQAILHESSLPHVQTSVDQSEQRPFTPFFCSPLIRGRQAFSDFQIQMERERHKELDALVQTKAVSEFSHRGRIQAVLKVRFLHRGAEVNDHQRLSCSVSDSNRPKQSAILHLREIFSLGAKQCASQLQRPQAKVVDCNTEIEKSSVSCRQGNGNPQKKNTEPIKSAAVVKSDSCAHTTERDIKNHGSNDMTEKSKIEVQSSERKENHPPELPQQEKDPVTTSKGSSDTENSFRLMPLEDVNHRGPDSMVQSSAHSLQNSGKVYQEASSGTNYIQQYSSPNFCIHRKPEFPTTGTSSQCSEGNVCTKFCEANNQQLAGDWEQEKDNNHHLDCSWVNDWINDGLEELQSDYSQEEADINHDWINDVSRPRSTWEDLRQARYQEMLDPFVENDDIRHLLQRKSVSSFLSSGMRENIDRLMMSRTQEISRKDHLEGKCENQYNREDQMRMNKVKEEHGCEEEEEYKQNSEEEEEEAEDDDSIVYNDDYEEDQEHNIQTERYNAAQSYINQTTSWVHSQHHDVSDNDSDQAAAPPLYIQHSPLANARILDSQRSNISCLDSQRSMNHHSVEMELIYELKGNMEQLHQEISEIRRSLKACVNMQMELQQSIKQEIVAALCQPGKQKRRERKDSSRGGRCCICSEEPIDSLLYRCGHMCTCFACAHELQWRSGKCPVCRAPILDIVRACAHSCSANK